MSEPGSSASWRRTRTSTFTAGPSSGRTSRRWTIRSTRLLLPPGRPQRPEGPPLGPSWIRSFRISTRWSGPSSVLWTHRSRVPRQGYRDEEGPPGGPPPSDREGPGGGGSLRELAGPRGAGAGCERPGSPGLRVVGQPSSGTLRQIVRGWLRKTMVLSSVRKKRDRVISPVSHPLCSIS